MAVANGKITVVGHHEANPGTGRVNEEYDPATDSWASKSRYPQSDGRLNLGNAVVDGEIYFFGGNNISNNYSTQNINKYNPATDVWTPDIASYPVPVSGLGAVAYGDAIYLFGGQNYNSPNYTAAYKFDPGTHVLTPIQDMPAGRLRAMSFVVDDKIWVVGGDVHVPGGSTAPVRTTLIYDFATDTWSSLPGLLPDGRIRWAGQLDNGGVYAVYSTDFPEVYRYRPEAEQWDLVSTAPLRQVGFGGVSIGNRIHLIGGNNPLSRLHQVWEAGDDSDPDPAWYDSYDFSGLGIIGYWPFDDLSGREVTGNGADATPVNVQLETGVAGAAYRFATASDYVDLNTSLNELEPFSVSFWARPEKPAGVARMISTSVNASQGGGGFDIHYNMDHPEPAHFRLYDQGERVVSADQDILLGDWQHIVAVWDGTNASIYLNGVLQGASSATIQPRISPATMKVGALGGLFARHEDFVGAIDEVIVFDRALSGADVLALAADTDGDGQVDFWAGSHTTPPAAEFSWSPQPTPGGAPIQFTPDATGNQTSWSWNFGDGTTSSERNPTHIYPWPGRNETYTVTLTVTNAAGAATNTEEVVVWNPIFMIQPDIEASYQPAPKVARNVPVTFQSHTLSGFPDQWEWDIRVVDPSTGAVTSQAVLAGEVATYAFPESGVYRVHVTARDSALGYEGSDLLLVQVVDTGVSNVAFFPGAPGSELWKDDAKLWLKAFPDTCAMKPPESDGTVAFDGIVTDDILHYIPPAPDDRYRDQYGDFEKYMDDLEASEFINTWQKFPYDWRLSVAQTARDGIALLNPRPDQLPSQDLANAIRSLARKSQTGKVTVVAHSNGGLLARELLDARSDELDEIVDRVILIGSPLEGTPKALPTILHGDDFPAIDYSLETREALETMPGLYALLPTSELLKWMNSPGGFPDDPIVSFRRGQPVELLMFELLEHFYPNDIRDEGTLRDFLLGVRILDRVEPHMGACADVPSHTRHAPNVLGRYSELIAEARSVHDATFPSDVEIIQIAGYGLPTFRGMEYWVQGYGDGPASPPPHLAYDPLFTDKGDGTVIAWSATSLRSGNTRTYWVDLPGYNRRHFNRKHANLAGVPSVLEVVRRVLGREEITEKNAPAHIFLREPEIESHWWGTKLESPVTIRATDAFGFSTGPNVAPGLAAEEEIANSSYSWFSGHPFLFLEVGPAYFIDLDGLEMGTFSLQIDRVLDDVNVDSWKYVDIPVSPDSIGWLTLESPEDPASLLLDVDGDGLVDVAVSPDSDAQPLVSVTILTDIVEALALPHGVRNSFTSKLDAAARSLARDRVDAARGQLGAFMNHVEAQRGEHVDESTADDLLRIVEVILASI